MAANAAVTVARLGGIAAFWGRGGDDAAGREMHKALAGEGVDVSQFRLFADGQSSVSGVLVDSAGERQIVNFRGNFPESADWLALGEVENASAVLADPRWLSGAVALFTAARANAVPTVLDADVADAERVRDAPSADRSCRLLGARVVRLCRLDRRQGAGQDRQLRLCAWPRSPAAPMVSHGWRTKLSTGNRPMRSTPSIPRRPVTCFTAPMPSPSEFVLRRPPPCRLRRRQRRSNVPARAGVQGSPRWKIVLHFKGTANENDRKDTRPCATGGYRGPFSHGRA